MRITIFTSDPFYPLLGGGTERVLNIALEFKRRGEEVTIVTPKCDPSEELRKKFDFIEIKHPQISRFRKFKPLKYSFYSFVAAVTFLAKKQRPDLIYAYDIVGGTTVLLIKPFFKTKWIQDIGDFRIGYSRLPFITKYEKSFPRFSNKIVSTTDEIKKELIKAGCNEKNFIIVPEGVDTSRYNKNARIKMRNKLNIAPEDFVIYYHGGIEKHDGIDMLIEAFSLFRDKIKNAKLVIIGGGGEADRLKRLVNDHKFKEDIVMPGWIPQTEVPDYLPIADVCTVPLEPSYSTHMVTTVKILEYWASEKPVLSTNLRHVSSIIDKNNVGIVRKYDSRDFADGLFYFYHHPEKAKKLAKNGKDYVLKNHDFKIIRKKIVDFCLG